MKRRLFLASPLVAGAALAWILKGEKPAAMPFDRATKGELIINNGTARSLGLAIPS